MHRVLLCEVANPASRLAAIRDPALIIGTMLAWKAVAKLNKANRFWGSDEKLDAFTCKIAELVGAGVPMPHFISVYSGAQLAFGYQHQDPAKYYVGEIYVEQTDGSWISHRGRLVYWLPRDAHLVQFEFFWYDIWLIRYCTGWPGPLMRLLRIRHRGCTGFAIP